MVTYTVAVTLKDGVTFLDLQSAIVEGLIVPGVFNVELIEQDPERSA